MDINQYKLVIIPQIDGAALPLRLPAPTQVNCGGYIRPSYNGNTEYDYSPIDLVVAATFAFTRRIEVTNLVDFFRKYEHRSTDTKLSLGIIVSPSDSEYYASKLVIESVMYWKMLALNSGELNMLLKKNAPLTFRRSYEW